MYTWPYTKFSKMYTWSSYKIFENLTLYQIFKNIYLTLYKNFLKVYLTLYTKFEMNTPDFISIFKSQKYTKIMKMENPSDGTSPAPR